MWGKSPSHLKVGRAVPSAPWEVTQTCPFRTSSDARGALGTARPTADLSGQLALKIHPGESLGLFPALPRVAGSGGCPHLMDGEVRAACEQKGTVVAYELPGAQQ